MKKLYDFKTMATAPRYEFVLLLPNLSLPLPTPFDCGEMVICAGNDPRLKQLIGTRGSISGRKLLKRYRTPFGDHYVPSCLLIREDFSKHFSKDYDALVGFRNICALVTACLNRTKAVRGNAQWEVLHSDHFAFGRYIPAPDGTIQSLGGPVWNLDEVSGFRGQCSPHLGSPKSFSLRPDAYLLDRLFKIWRLAFVNRHRRSAYKKLFRSMELAFHACQYPSDGVTTTNDVGTRITLWVNAFEALFHPGTGRVNKRHVQEQLALVDWDKAILKAQRYRITFNRKQMTVTLPEKIYDGLYEARNKFTHGDRILLRHLKYGRHKISLLSMASALYLAALTRIADICVPGTKIRTPKTVAGFTKWVKSEKGGKLLPLYLAYGLREVERGLLRAQGLPEFPGLKITTKTP
jgi:hypothetical protein